MLKNEWKKQKIKNNYYNDNSYLRQILEPGIVAQVIINYDRTVNISIVKLSCSYKIYPLESMNI